MTVTARAGAAVAAVVVVVVVVVVPRATLPRRPPRRRTGRGPRRSSRRTTRTTRSSRTSSRRRATRARPPSGRSGIHSSGPQLRLRRPAPSSRSTDDEDFDEPEIPEYLIAEQRRGAAGRGGGGGGGARGGRAAYQSAISRERYGRGGGGGINRYPDVSGRTPAAGQRQDRRTIAARDRRVAAVAVLAWVPVRQPRLRDAATTSGARSHRSSRPSCGRRSPASRSPRDRSMARRPPT